MEDKTLLNSISIAVAIVILSVISALIVGAIISSSVLECTNTTSSDNDSFLVQSLTSLSPIGSGITSSEVESSNDSWLSFGGTDEINSIADSNSLDLTTNFTISIWSNITSLEVLNSHYIDKYFGASGGYEIMLDNSSKQIEFKYENETNDMFSEEICPIPVEKFGQWFNIIIIFNSTHVSCYIDGVLNQTNTTIGSIKNTNKDMDFGNGINGNLDEYRIYNTTLTSSQISEVYDSGRVPNSSLPSDNLVFWVSFQEGAGLTVYDKSGFLNDGTIDGATRVNDGVNITLTEDTDYTINSATGLFTIINGGYSWAGMDASWVYVSGEDCPSGVNPNTIGNLFGEFIIGLLGFLGIIGIVLGVIWLVGYVNKLFGKNGLNNLGATA